jgi:16S rRNA (guanine527-N7)-methyltransferase
MAWTAEQMAMAFDLAGLDSLPDGSSERFRLYLELLLRWNKKISLTAIRTPEEIVRRHFVECAFVAQNLPAGIKTLLDFGSGAGFPGIPIAICRPEIHVTLAESHLKKAAFLEEAVRVLALSSEVFGRRVEIMPETRSFDAVALRAVDKMQRALLAARPRAGEFLILLTTEQAQAIHENLVNDFVWRKPLPLPYGNQSILLIGSRKSAGVPRGTLG